MSTTNATGETSTIFPAEWPRDEAVARHLLQHYTAHLANNPHGGARIYLTDFDQELALLPRTCVAPEAVFLIALIGNQPTGCVQIKTLHDVADACEMKRLWTEPPARGRGVGRALIRAAIEWSREHGARKLLLDTVPAAMPEAVALYQSFGFENVTRYNDNPVKDLQYMWFGARVS